MVEILGAVVLMWTAFKLWAAGIRWGWVAGIFALIGIALALWSAWVFSKGHNIATLACTTGALAANERAGTDHAKEETQVYALPHRDLRDEYSRWLY